MNTERHSQLVRESWQLWTTLANKRDSLVRMNGSLMRGFWRYNDLANLARHRFERRAAAAEAAFYAS